MFEVGASQSAQSLVVGAGVEPAVFTTGVTALQAAAIATMPTLPLVFSPLSPHNNLIWSRAGPLARLCLAVFQFQSAAFTCVTELRVQETEYVV